MSFTSPMIPENAPFTVEQRGWLNGYLAGLQSAALAKSPGVPGEMGLAPLQTQATTTSILILYGSQSGTAEGLAHQLANTLRKTPTGVVFTPKVLGMENFSTVDWVQESHVLLITSTWGDGDMPDNAVAFWESLNSEMMKPVPHLCFAVLGLGDKSYRRFCQAGKNLDARFEFLGARRLIPTVLCDTDYEDQAASWMQTVVEALKAETPNTPGTEAQSASILTSSLGNSPESPSQQKTQYDRKNPFPAALLQNHSLNGKGSVKDTRHFSFSLHASGLSYKVGDALGVVARNDFDLVDRIILRLNCQGNESVTLSDGETMALRKALLEKLCLRRATPELLQAIQIGTLNPRERETLQSLLRVPEGDETRAFLLQRDVLDVLEFFSQSHPAPDQVVTALGKLAPRLYSIASSPKESPDEVHLCVGVQRVSLSGRIRRGVASTYLAERVPLGSPVGIFIQATSHFTLPPQTGVPVIMVGPGTGIAPFRAFLQERRQLGDNGKNWLFFGDQCQATDFLYAKELLAMHTNGFLHKLSLAFSRDQAQKIYVQDRMLEAADELFAWLENGAFFYVCGDAKRMAKDVDETLHRIIASVGNLNEAETKGYVENLKKTKRYLRDVY